MFEGFPEAYRTWEGTDPFEDHAGPFLFREFEDGRVVCGFMAETRHLNGGGVVHGGALMAFADFALFSLSRAVLREESGVTISFDSQFLGAGVAGHPVFAVGGPTRNARSLLFVRGELLQKGETIMTFNGVIKKRPRISPRSQG